MLDTQRTGLEAQVRYIEVLGTYHRANVQVHRLIGQEIDDLSE
jgi:outer membrane protein TolC